ncbi:MAG: MgtC/SapB family protein [Candidatus Hatepunaea meridiana]|nr:MgtC/SapB family protein [Candidatus Hatepunaea meridiana]
MEDLAKLGELLPRFIIEILVAIICGGLIGLERGIRKKGTGIRDNILICVSAVLFLIVAEIVKLGSAPDVISITSYVFAGVIIGTAILGAGVIIGNSGDQVSLSTAATTWVIAAIGLIIGTGNYLFGLLITGLILLTLTMLHGIEKHLKERPRPLLLKLVLREDNPEIRKELQDMLERHHIKPDSYRSERGSFGVKITIQALEEPKDIRLLSTDLWTIKGVTEVEH